MFDRAVRHVVRNVAKTLTLTASVVQVVSDQMNAPEVKELTDVTAEPVKPFPFGFQAVAK